VGVLARHSARRMSRLGQRFGVDQQDQLGALAVDLAAGCLNVLSGQVWVE